MAAVLPVVPLTALPPGVADWLATAVVLAALVAALWSSASATGASTASSCSGPR